MTETPINEPDVIEALNAGRTIEAIKLLRASRGIDLKQAKDLVDGYMEKHGLSENQSNSSIGAQNLILLIALAVVAYYIFNNYL